MRPHDSVDPAEKQYPREYFAAPLYFAATIAALSGRALIETIEAYTGLYREITGDAPIPGTIDPRWADLTTAIANHSDPAALTELVYACYCQQPHSRYDRARNGEGARIFGMLGYVYDAPSRQVRTHVFPQRSPESPLSSKHLHRRRAEFKQLLADVQHNHPDAATLKSSTWLQNLPNYRNLFPGAFTARLQNIGGGSYLGIWGQFVRSDGRANPDRLAQFKANLAHAQTLAEAIDAFPHKVLEAVGPIQAFYAEYGLER